MSENADPDTDTDPTSRVGIRRLPPLNALRAFEAAARLESFLAAASELNVTPAAISHQVKQLEADLGVKLFERLPRGVETTPAAREMLPEISRGFAHFSRGLGALTGGALAGRLTVSVARSFATLWLVPRIGDFVARFPEIDLQVLANDRAVDVTRGEADLRITYSRGLYPGMSVEPLMGDTIFPVAAPALLNRQPIRTFADLAGHVLLQDIDIAQDEAAMTWARWMRDAGVAERKPAGWIELNDSVLLTQAALHGQGVGLGRMALVGGYLASGQLVRPLKLERPADYSYFTVTSEELRQHPRVRVFVDWLKRQSAADPGPVPV
ncbi:MAG: LysR substrate-binding domain-containing protein [Pseudomonadota bacterium]